jgi:protoporphyrinogen oxidase
MKRVVVIGGGLAGLSAGHHLAEHEPVVLEKESELGGLCRSFTQDGFTFDCTGHLIHLKNQYTKDLIANLLPNAFTSHERLAAIYSKQTTTPYPFQANTYGLPAEVVRDCIVGFVDTLQTNHDRPPSNFHEWNLRTFGAGIAKHFMLPYNEKFWKQDLRGITADWVNWAIPKPTLEEVVNGALGITNKGMGYNPRFIYPANGGIDCLPQALGRSIRKIYLNESATIVDTRKKCVRLSSGREEPYDYLISTTPLPLLFKMLSEVPENLRKAAERLRAISVLNINIGVNRPKISDQHWIYFPEREFIFSRIGFPMNFSASVGPAGTSSVYIEITHPPDQMPNVDEAYERSIHGLQKCGILNPDDRILTRHVLDIRYAYVVFDEHRQRHLQSLVDYLEAHNIFTTGRYGLWDYYSMEDSILSGKKIAEKISAVCQPHFV